VEELYRVVGDCATSHFIFAKNFLPRMKQDASSSFLFVTGGAGGLCGRAAWGQRGADSMGLAGEVR